MHVVPSSLLEYLTSNIRLYQILSFDILFIRIHMILISDSKDECMNVHTPNSDGQPHEFLVAGGRYWSLGNHMNFWVREEHMNPRLERRIGGLANKPRFSCSAHGFT
ncbi:hypothetical protein QL285_083208 [Trifolium repens]|nr:hypothetical protein QL285_083208 [Trifolium repens]